MATKSKSTKQKKQPKLDLNKKRKGRTLTGKAAAEINISPTLKIHDSLGRPLHESVAVIANGRMNPPSIAHEFLVSEVHDIALEVGGIPMLFLSNTVNKNNPLSHSTKLALVEEAFGDKIFVIPENISNPIEMLKLVAEHFDHVIWVAGEDQIKDYTRIIEDYNNVEFVFESAEVVCVGHRDPESTDLIESMSATKLRQAALVEDISTFEAGLPEKLQPHARQIMEEVQNGLKLFEKKPRTIKEQLVDGIVKQKLIR